MRNDEFLTYFKRNRELSIPYFSNKFGLSIKDTCALICSNYKSFPDAGMVDGLYYYSQPNNQWFYEVCNTKFRRGRYVRWEQLDKYNKANNKEDQHHSVYGHDHRAVTYARKNKKVSGVDEHQIKLHNLYLEIDRKIGGFDKVLKDVSRICWRLNIHSGVYPEVWFSGNSSIHLAVDARLIGSPQGLSGKIAGFGKVAYRTAHQIAGDVRYRNKLIDSWTTPLREVMDEYERVYKEPADKNTVRQIMENLDPNMYSTNSVIRAPYSVHEKGGKAKVAYHPDRLYEREAYVPKRVDFLPPTLLHYYVEEYERKINYNKKVDCDVNNDYILFEFLDMFKDLDPATANGDGWCSGLYNPWYDDGNPSLAVNLDHGTIHDFGHPDYRFNFIDFLMKKYNINKTTAQELIDANE